MSFDFSLAARFQAAIATVCPVLEGSVRIGNRNDRETWTWAPDPSATAPQIAAGEAAATAFDETPRRPRELQAIWEGLDALTALKKAAIWTDITSGSPAKWRTNTGANRTAIFSAVRIVLDLGLVGAALTKAKETGVALYCQDNPTYLVNPAFDVAINIPGDEPDT